MKSQHRARRRSALVAAVTAVVMPSVAWAFTLANPSMEQGESSGTKPAGWSGSAWGDVKATFAWQDVAVDGKKSLKVQVTQTGASGDAKWASGPAAVTKGTRLMLSHQYRSTVTTMVLVHFVGANNKQTFFQIAAPAASNGKWATTSGTVLVPDWANTVAVMHVIKQVGTLETDAWKVSAVVQKPEPKLPLAALANPSAENANPNNPTEPFAWNGSSWGDGAASLSWIDGGVDGKKALRAKITTAGTKGDAKWLSLPFVVKAGTRLKVGNRYRCDVNTTVLMKFDGTKDGKPKTEYYTVAEAQPSGGQWATMTGIQTVPAWAKQASVAHLIAAAGTLDVDAWSVGLAKSDEFVVPPKGKIPLVSITFDDGWTSGFHLLIGEMDKRGLRGSHFIVADFIDKTGFQADYMGKDKIIELLKNKHELGSHSWKHRDIAKLSQTELDKELGDSRKRLQQLFGVDVVGFAPPYGSYNDDTLPALKKHYKYSRTVKGGLNEKPYKLHELYTIVVHNKMDMDEFTGWVVKAAVEGKWLILLYHRAAKDPPSDSYINPVEFVRQMDYLVNVKADVKPIGEVLGVWTPVSVETLTPDIVTGKALDPAPAVKKNTQYLQPIDPNTGGCAASQSPELPGKSALLLALVAVIAVGTWRRRGDVTKSGA